MAIDFYGLSDVKLTNKLFSLSEIEFDLLESSLSKFEKKTGVLIDAYATTKLYPDHVKLIIEILNIEILLQEKSKNKDMKRLLDNIKKKLLTTNDGLIIVGE